MRMIEQTTRFRRDYKRELKGRYASDLDAGLREVLIFLVEDRALPTRYRDHALIASLATAVGLSSAQVDDLFRSAAAL